uniref:Enkurin domain-containing protein n=1 Tax=Cryptomonas curvata TaxID=233186 RepID=A0A7S0M7I4_9CRYP
MRGGNMAAALAPERDNLRAKMARAGVEVKDHAQEYKVKIKEQSIVNGLVKAQGEVPQTRPAARKPEFSGRPQNIEPGQPNFVQDNKHRALDHAAKVREAAVSSKSKPPKYSGPEADRVPGRLPKYLVERKLEMDVEKAMAMDAEESKKGGPKVMPEEERLSTLAELNAQKKAALLELNSIPISKTQLPVYQNQIRTIETRLAEIDNAILLFSRKIVFVQ